MSIKSGKIKISEGIIVKLDKRKFVLKSIKRTDIDSKYYEYVMINDTIKILSSKKILFLKNQEEYIKGKCTSDPYKSIGLENNFDIDIESTCE